MIFHLFVEKSVGGCVEPFNEGLDAAEGVSDVSALFCGSSLRHFIQNDVDIEQMILKKS